MTALLALLSTAQATTCLGWGPGTLIARTEGAPITESSGLAAAQLRPGVWFTHGDSGGDAELFSFQLDSTFLDTHPIADAHNEDWEDLSAGPCPAELAADRPCLFVGDIGDNLRRREEIAVYIVGEPGPGEAAPLLATWRARYPEGPEDSESLFVHPRSGRVYLATKDSDGLSAIYAFPPGLGGEGVVGTLEKVADLDLSAHLGIKMTTGADWEPDGHRLVIRTYDRLFVWNTDPCAPDAHWGRPPNLDLPLAFGELQGEAVAFTAEGDLLTSEEGSPMEVSRFDCVGEAHPVVDCEGGADTAEPGPDDSDAPDPVDSDAPRDSATPETSEAAPKSGSTCGCSGGGSASALLLIALALRIPRSSSSPRRRRSSRP